MFDNIRRLVQIIAFGIFIFQMFNSINKYIERPVVQQSSTETFEELQVPEVYVCQDSQFNFTEVNKLGYKNLASFLVGMKKNSSLIQWTDGLGNATFQDLKSSLYNSNYTGYFAKVSDTGNYNDWNISEDTEIFTLQHGMCKKLKTIKKGTIIYSKFSSIIILVDPAKDSPLKVFQIENGFQNFAHKDNGFYSSHTYEVELSIHDSSVYDGVSCTNYERIESSYRECLETALRLKFLQWYGCLPPWFPNLDTLSCELNKNVPKPDSETQIDITNEFAKLIDGLELDTFKSCLPPCRKLQLKHNLLSHYSNRIHNAYVKFMIKDEVKVFRHAYAYDMFSLVVDLGSSLGLWLGLSALSIFDNIFLVYKNRNKRLFCP